MKSCIDGSISVKIAAIDINGFYNKTAHPANRAAGYSFSALLKLLSIGMLVYPSECEVGRKSTFLCSIPHFLCNSLNCTLYTDQVSGILHTCPYDPWSINIREYTNPPDR